MILHSASARYHSARRHRTQPQYGFCRVACQERNHRRCYRQYGAPYQPYTDGEMRDKVEEGGKGWQRKYSGGAVAARSIRCLQASGGFFMRVSAARVCSYGARSISCLRLILRHGALCSAQHIARHGYAAARCAPSSCGVQRPAWSSPTTPPARVAASASHGRCLFFFSVPTRLFFLQLLPVCRQAPQEPWQVG